MAEYKVLYIESTGKDVYDLIRSQLPSEFGLVTLNSKDPEEKLQKIRDADFILVATSPVTEKLIEAAPKLKLIQHQGVGYDNIDVKAAQKRGIPVGLTPEGTSIGVAEHTILLMLAIYKRLLIADASLREGKWLQWQLRPFSYELFGKTLGLVGMGRIGREVAKRARAFEMKILYYDKLIKLTKDEEKRTGAQSCSFEELLAYSDIVSLHSPLTKETEKMMKEKEFKIMKRSAIFINTARGRLVDETALCWALEKKEIAGAGLDVFFNEPLDPQSPLLKMDNIVVTPHISAGTTDALLAKMKAAFSNMIRVIKGQEPNHIVKTEQAQS